MSKHFKSTTKTFVRRASDFVENHPVITTCTVALVTFGAVLSVCLAELDQEHEWRPENDDSQRKMECRRKGYMSYRAEDNLP